MTTQQSSVAPTSLRILVIILGSLTAFGPLSIDMYLPAFPSIAADFQVSVAVIQQSLSAFFFGLAVGQLCYGPLIDRFGRKKPVIFGLAIYCAASIACALAPRSEALVWARLFQALGGCAGMVAARAVVRDLFNERESARVFSLLMLVMGIAPILAPLIGGYVNLQIGWRAIFGLHAIISAICLGAVVLYFPETRGPNPHFKASAVLQTYAGIAKGRRFLGFALAGGVAQAGMFAYITGSPFVLIQLFEVPAEHYGWIFGTNAFGLIAASQINARLLKKHGPEWILRRALLIIATAGLGLGIASALQFNLWSILIPLFVFVSCLGITLPNTTAAALAAEGPRAGSASALLGTLQFTAAATASAAVSFFDNGTALPMGGVIAACGLISCGLGLSTLQVLRQSAGGK